MIIDKKQKGFSLIELLVASTLGILLIAGVITSFIGTKESDKLRNAITEMDASARVAIQILQQTLSNAGYPSVRNIRIEKAFYSKKDGAVTNLSCGGGVKRFNDSDGTPGASQYTRDQEAKGDVLTVVYLADNPCKPGNAKCDLDDSKINPNAIVFTDCAGGGATRKKQAVSCSTENMPKPEEAKIYSTFYMSSVKHTLYCRGSRAGTQPLVDNIENIQFLYGVTLDDGTTRYMKADLVEAGDGAGNDWWGLVKSIQVGLLMRSYDKYLLKKDGPDKYIVLDEKITINEEERRRLYRVYTTTIDLQNLTNKGGFL